MSKKKLMQRIGRLEQLIVGLNDEVQVLVGKSAAESDQINEAALRNRREIDAAKKLVQACMGTRARIEQGVRERGDDDLLLRLDRRVAYLQELAGRILVSKAVRVINPACHAAFDPDEHQAIGETLALSDDDLPGTVASVETVGFEQDGVVHAAEVILYGAQSEENGKEVEV